MLQLVPGERAVKNAVERRRPQLYRAFQRLAVDHVAQRDADVASGLKLLCVSRIAKSQFGPKRPSTQQQRHRDRRSQIESPHQIRGAEPLFTSGETFGRRVERPVEGRVRHTPVDARKLKAGRVQNGDYISVF